MIQEKSSILIVDDEPVVRDSLVHWFTEEGHEVAAVASAADALTRLAAHETDLIIADIRMPGIDGLELLERIRAAQDPPAVIMMTAYASVDSAVRALKHGAFDYVTKPFDPDDLSVVARNALEQHRLKRENRLLRQQLAESSAELVGQSQAIERVREQIETVAGVDCGVLIVGESGTGKEMVARAIHRLSPRRDQPMVVVHCGALGEAVIESELFGHEKGAFPGAHYRRQGKLEAAVGGTVLLDEIAEIGLKTQADLLQVLQDRALTRVGGAQPVKIDCRVIAATNRDLTELVTAGRFRTDLYYRLNVLTIHLPPLRERHGDVLLLADHFLDKYSKQMNRRFTGFDRAALDLLIGHPWPGNVRELENLVERAVVVGHEPLVRAHDLALNHPPNGGEDLTMEALERKHIVRVLEDFGWNQTQASKALGIDRVTLYHKIRRYGLHAPDRTRTAQA